MSYSLKAYDRFMYFFEKKALDDLRKEILDDVDGRVLEIGPGTGVNLKYFNKNTISQLTYIDVDYTEGLEKKAKEKCPNINFVDGSVEKMPFEDNSFDHVIFTLVFCSVKNPINGLSEIKRVLKKNGKIHFIEHVLPEKRPLKGIFNSFNSFWHKLSGGCNLNRQTIDTIRDAGFHIDIAGKGFNSIFVAGTGKVK